MRSDMRKVAALWLAAICLCGALTLAGCSPPAPPAVHQVSTLQALMQGACGGWVPCRDLPRFGTLGIGTFDGLDGELIMLDGQVYQATADGRVICNPPTTVPFADVVPFEPQDEVRDVPGPLDLEQLLAMLDGRAASRNLLYAVRIDGQFRRMKVRSVPGQTRPYLPLAEAVKQQRVYDLLDVRGTLVGFRFPEYLRGVNMPGWHLHFISDDRRCGGHVLGLLSGQVDIRLQAIRRFEMILPVGGAFIEADLGKDMSREMHEVEK